MKQYYAYSRVSTVKQGEGASLEAQHEAIQAYGAKHGLNIVKWFEEKETAAKDTRPIFNAMITDLKRGRAHGLIVHKIDRSARNFKDWAKIGDLVEMGCDVHFAFESLDLNSRGGRLAADIQAVVSADYIRNLRDESIKGQRTRLRQGLYPYKAPLGYLDNGKAKHKTICQVAGPLVRTMFELYASGEHSIRSLTIEMERRGLRSRNNQPLAKTSIEQMLKNPFYAGVIKIRRSGEVYEGKHTPLISPELFAAVTRQRTGGRTVQKQTRHNHTYRGLWRCGLCDQAMTPERQKGHVYYRCQNTRCATKCIVEPKLEQAVLTMLETHGLTDERCAEIETAVLSHLKSADNKPAVDHARAEIKKLAARERRLNEKFLDQLIDDALYKQLREEIIQARHQQQAFLARHRDKRISEAQLSAFLERAKNLYLSYISATPAEKRQIVKYTSSNRRVIRKNVEVEPQDWLVTLQNDEVSNIVRIIRSQIEKENTQHSNSD